MSIEPTQTNHMYFNKKGEFDHFGYEKNSIKEAIEKEGALFDLRENENGKFFNIVVPDIKNHTSSAHNNEKVNKIK